MAKNVGKLPYSKERFLDGLPNLFYQKIKPNLNYKTTVKFLRTMLLVICGRF